MTSNQTFPILNVITENLRLSHGHVLVVPHCKGKAAEGDESDSVNALRIVKPKGVINTHGTTSFGVERTCNKCQHISGDCAESFSKFAQNLQKSQHFCSRHRNSLQDDASTVREAKSFAFESLNNYTNFGEGTETPHLNSAGCGSTLPRSYEPSVKDKFCGQLANRTNEGLARKDVLGVNHCRCGCAAAQRVLCGLRSDSLLTRASDVRHGFPVRGESILHLYTQAGLSKVIHSGCENRNPVGHNLSYKTNKVRGSDSSAVNAWKPISCLRHATEKLQDTVVMWWRQPLEGQLFKYTNVMKGWQYRWFVLNPELGKLEYFEKEEHKKCYRPRGFLRLVGAMVCPSDEDSQTFTVNATNGESYRLKAFDARERQHWVNRLRATSEYHTESLTNPSTLNRNGHVTTQSPSLNASPNANRPVENVSQTRHPPRTRVRDSSKPSIPKDHVVESTQSVSLSFKDCSDQLSAVRRNHHLVMTAIESLPSCSSPGNVISSLDKDMLLLKATSSAVTLCFEKCLSLLTSQASIHKDEKPTGLQNSSSILLPANPPSYSSLQLHDTTDHTVSSKNSPLHLCYSGQLQENTVSDVEARINHDDEVEDPEPYTDVELSGMEEHKNVILHLLSQLKLGMDLTKVVLPTFILEKRSLLEMFADCMAHPDLFLRIPEMPTPESRMLAVVEWFLTSFHSGRQGSIAKKPYNPIIGETFHCSWIVNEVASDVAGQHSGDQDPSAASSRTSSASQSTSATNLSSDVVSQQSYLYYCAEQVSHHPPVSAFYYENPERQICMDASIWTRSKFMGMSVGVAMIGKVHLHLLTYGEEYEFSLPSAYARSILTVPWVELGDKVTISCEKTGYSAAVIFHTKPFYGGRLHRVTAEVKNPSSEPICKISGEWNGQMEFTYANGSSKIVDTSHLPVARKHVRPLKMQGGMESRKLWQKVTESLQNGDVTKATECKQQLEEIQRQNEKQRRESRMPFPTKYFCQVGDEWIFKKRLRPGQKEPSI